MMPNLAREYHARRKSRLWQIQAKKQSVAGRFFVLRLEILCTCGEELVVSETSVILVDESPI